MQIKIKGDLVRVVLCKFGVVLDVIFIDIEFQFMQDVVDDFEVMMVEWYQDGKGIIIGYVFLDDDNFFVDGDDYGFCLSVVSVVFYNLVCRIVLDYVFEVIVKIIVIVKYGKEFFYKQIVIVRVK